MIRAEPDRWQVEGRVTIDTYTGLLEQSRELGTVPATVDWSSVTDVDSSALALMFAWQRTARANGGSVRHVNLGDNLESLAALYGVSDLIETQA